MTFLSDVTNPNASNKPYIQDSTEMGNYSGTLKTTGQYAIKNIYDLAGNAWEWTMEKYSLHTRVLRGGNYDYNGSSNPDSRRYYDYPDSSISINSARAVLYL